MTFLVNFTLSPVFILKTSHFAPSGAPVSSSHCACVLSNVAAEPYLPPELLGLRELQAAETSPSPQPHETKHEQTGEHPLITGGHSGAARHWGRRVPLLRAGSACAETAPAAAGTQQQAAAGGTPQQAARVLGSDTQYAGIVLGWVLGASVSCLPPGRAQEPGESFWGGWVPETFKVCLSTSERSKHSKVDLEGGTSPI